MFPVGSGEAAIHCGREKAMTGIINSLYVASSAIAALASLNSRSRTDACWWLVTSLGLCSLTILRTAEAGVWTDEYLRSGLYRLGWYHDRRLIQIICIAAFALALLPARKLLPGKRTALAVAVAGFYALAVFAAVRSSSLHWSDAVLEEQVGSVMLSHVIQIVLLLVISATGIVQCLENSRAGASKLNR